MFTAIAMIAFSSASMANTIAKKDNSTENRFVGKDLILKKTTIQQEANPCKNNFSIALNQAYQMGYNDSQAWNYASVAYIFCSNGLVPPVY